MHVVVVVSMCITSAEAPPGEPTLARKKHSSGRKWYRTLTTSYSMRHSLLRVSPYLCRGYVHICTHFPVHPPLPQHAKSCASSLPRVVQRRPGPVSSLGINTRSASAFQSRVRSATVEQEKVKGRTFGGISALLGRMRWQVISSSMLENEKRDNA
jgi:hypothetical protein